MTTNPASVDDVEIRWRPLTGDERQVAQTRLKDGWRTLRRRLSDLEQRMAASPDLADEVTRVLADAVIRLLRNPDGLRRGTVSVDDASRTVDYGDGSHVGGGLYFTDDELESLLPVLESVTDGRAFSVMPS